MGCSNSKEEPRAYAPIQTDSVNVNEYYPAPPKKPDPGPSRMPSNATQSQPSYQSPTTSALDEVYAALLPLKKRFWIDPDDCGSSRTLKSSYMVTHVGYYQGHPTVIKSIVGLTSVQPAQSRKNAVADLIKEIRALAKLHHPNIVAFLGFTYTTVDDLKCVTEFMDGGNLRALLNNPKRDLSWRREKLSIAIDVATALMYLHNLKPKIMHRNIKAEKVHLTASLSAKLSGFGSAREWSYTHTMTQKSARSNGRPQNSFSTKITTKKSIFTPLGLLLVELDTRELPYANHHDTSSVLVTNIITGVVRPTVGPNCPKIVRALREEQSRVAEAAVGKLSAAKAKEPIPAANPASIDNVTSIPHQDFYKLGPLQSRFWLHPQDCVVSRQIPSSYMCTMLGHYRGDPVVVKTLDMNQGANIDVDRKYLVREISMMAKLEHPNIITFYGFTFTNANDLKCVTEFMAGGTLRTLLDKKKRELTWPSEKLRISMDVAQGLAYLHGQSLMHRNIKASKVLLTPGLGTIGDQFIAQL
ncbi:hypothetical protein Ae201684P_009581 [Aphanomyces euteiches]|nr:hypothetical protein Ae201684P_009581 [Aphanomyces euteiches]